MDTPVSLILDVAQTLVVVRIVEATDALAERCWRGQVGQMISHGDGLGRTEDEGPVHKPVGCTIKWIQLGQQLEHRGNRPVQAAKMAGCVRDLCQPCGRVVTLTGWLGSRTAVTQRSKGRPVGNRTYRHDQRQ